MPDALVVQVLMWKLYKTLSFIKMCKIEAFVFKPQPYWSMWSIEQAIWDCCVKCEVKRDECRKTGDGQRNAGCGNMLMQLLTCSSSSSGSGGSSVRSLSSEQVWVGGELILGRRLQHGVRRAAVQQGHLTLPNRGGDRWMRAWRRRRRGGREQARGWRWREGTTCGAITCRQVKD